MAEQITNDFPRELRQLLLAWAALLLLLFCSLGSAYLRLGVLNTALGLGIATVKTAIVVWLFMRLRQASWLTRVVAASGLGALCLLVGLAGVDYATRVVEPAATQPPQQLKPLRDSGTTP